jgi:hypothetical protein
MSCCPLKLRTLQWAEPLSKEPFKMTVRLIISECAMNLERSDILIHESEEACFCVDIFTYSLSSHLTLFLAVSFSECYIEHYSISDPVGKNIL